MKTIPAKNKWDSSFVNNFKYEPKLETRTLGRDGVLRMRAAQNKETRQRRLDGVVEKEELVKTEMGEIAPLHKIRTTAGSSDYKEKISKTLKAKWQDPEFRAEQLANPERQRASKEASVNMKKKWEDEDYRKEQLANLRSVATLSPEARAQQKETLKAKWADPEYRAQQLANPNRTPISRAHTNEANAKRTATVAAKWADPEFRAKQLANPNRLYAQAPKAQAKKSAAMKAKWQDPEFRALQIAARKNK